MSLDGLLHLRHDLIVRDAGFDGRHRLFDFRAKPRVIGFPKFDHPEFGLDGRELSHVASLADGGGG